MTRYAHRMLGSPAAVRRAPPHAAAAVIVCGRCLADRDERATFATRRELLEHERAEHGAARPRSRRP